MENQLPKATHQGQLDLGSVSLDCYVLENGKRVFHKRGMARALNIKSRGGNVFIRTISSKGLGSEISQKLMVKISNPIIFMPLSGDQGHGYEADVLIDVCDSIIEARNNGKLTPSQEFLAIQSEMIIRAVAKVGIVALIDEATGYQEDRAKDALTKILEMYLSEELQKWAKTFPDEFYREMFRLKGWEWKPWTVKRPGIIGKYTVDLIYDRIAPGVREELETKNPKISGGHRKAKHHQWFNPEIGHPKLKEHISGIIALMRAAANWREFERLVNRSFPKPLADLPLFRDVDKPKPPA